LGWQREFSFSGDQAFHLKQAYYLAFWWLSPPLSPAVEIVGRALGIDAVRELLAKPWEILWSRAAILITVTVVGGLLYRRNRLLALVFAIVTLVLWGLVER